MVPNEQEELPSEKKPIGQIHHLRISRKDTIVNDLKNSTRSGIAAFVLALVSWILLFVSLMVSYAAKGNADIRLGILLFVGFLLGIFSILFAIRGWRNKEKIRHYMEKRAVILSILSLLLYLALFLYGVWKYTNG